MLSFQTLFASFGISRDSAVWFWGKFAGTILFMASIGADATALGVPEGWLRGIQVLALWVTYMSAQNSTSLLNGDQPVEDESEDMSKWLSILEKLGPAVLAVTPAAPAVPFILAGMKIAEQIPNADGAQKKQFVLEFVKLAGQAAESVQANQPQVVAPPSPPPPAPLPPAVDPHQVEISKAIDTVVDIVNLIQKKI